MLFPAGRINAESKIKIYKKIIEEVYREYKGAHEFIANKVLKKEYLLRRYVLSLDQIYFYYLFSIKIAFCFEM